MKMSKQERIALVVFLVLLTLGIGIFMFVVPVFDKINASDALLNNKKIELAGYLEKQATKDAMKDEVIAAYEAGRNEANMFFEEMTTYEIDKEINAFIKYCQKDLKITVESLNISETETATLSVSFFDSSEISYNLKTFATQGVEATQEELDKLAAEMALREKLNYTQDVGVASVSFTVSALDQEELIKFADKVNQYFKEEDGTGSTRKAMMLNGFSANFPEIKVEGDEDEIQLPSLSVDAEGNVTVNAPEDEEDKLCTMDATITLYCIERMQDPKAQLEAQELLTQVTQ